MGLAPSLAKDQTAKTVNLDMEMPFVPDFAYNLLSVSQLQDQGHDMHFGSSKRKNSSYVRLDNGTVLPLQRHGKLHILALQFPNVRAAYSAQETREYHNRLGHPSFERLLDMCKKRLIPLKPEECTRIITRRNAKPSRTAAT